MKKLDFKPIIFIIILILVALYFSKGGGTLFAAYDSVPRCGVCSGDHDCMGSLRCRNPISGNPCGGYNCGICGSSLLDIQQCGLPDINSQFCQGDIAFYPDNSVKENCNNNQLLPHCMEEWSGNLAIAFCVECRVDSDCASDAECIDYECEKFCNGENRPCLRNGDCCQGLQCKNGLCLYPNQQPDFCTDSDNGDYFTKGTTTIPDNTYLDICIDGVQLKEYSCSGKILKIETLTCANGCSQGACINSQTYYYCLTEDKKQCIEKVGSGGCDTNENKYFSITECEKNKIENGTQGLRKAKTITWFKYYSLKDKELISKGTQCNESSDCENKIGYSIHCEKSDAITERLNKGWNEICQEKNKILSIIFLPPPFSGIDINSAICSILYNIGDVANVLGSSVGVCIAESDNPVMGLFEGYVKAIADAGIPSQYVMMVAIGLGFLITFMLITMIGKI